MPYMRTQTNGEREWEMNKLNSRQSRRNYWQQKDCIPYKNESSLSINLCCFQCFKQLMLGIFERFYSDFFKLVMLIFVHIVFIFRSCWTRNSFDSIVGWCHFWIPNEFSPSLILFRKKFSFSLQSNFTKFYISSSVLKIKIHANHQMLENIIWNVSVMLVREIEKTLDNE